MGDGQSAFGEGARPCEVALVLKDHGEVAGADGDVGVVVAMGSFVDGQSTFGERAGSCEVALGL